jgi:hypothetical protein
MTHKSRLPIPAPALIASLAALALLALLAAPACSPSLNRYQAKEILADLPELKDVQKQIEFQSEISLAPGHSTVTAKVPVTFLLVEEGKSWRVDEIRLTDRQWVKVADLRRALEDKRWLDTQFAMLELARGLALCFHSTYAFPGAKDIVQLTDVLMPKYMPRLVRTDAWGTDFSFQPLSGGTRYQLASAGPDRKFRTEDDLVLIDGRIVAARPGE